MTGKWIGKYWFSGKVPESVKDRKTEFELIINNYQNNKIIGEVSDNVENGGTAGIGKISGSVKGNKIKFIKRMPIRTTLLPDGTRIEENKPHRPIYYSGIINLDSNSIKGTWKFKFGIGFVNGSLAFYPATKGEWEMKKV